MTYIISHRWYSGTGESDSSVDGTDKSDDAVVVASMASLTVSRRNDAGRIDTKGVEKDPILNFCGG